MDLALPFMKKTRKLLIPHICKQNEQPGIGLHFKR